MMLDLVRRTSLQRSIRQGERHVAVPGAHPPRPDSLASTVTMTPAPDDGSSDPLSAYRALSDALRLLLAGMGAAAPRTARPGTSAQPERCRASHPRHGGYISGMMPSSSNSVN